MTSRSLRRIVLVERHAAGGVFQFALLMGEALARRGHHVELVTPPEVEQTSTQPGLVHVPILPAWPQGVVLRRDGVRATVTARARYLRAWVRVVGHVRRTRPDVLHLADLLDPVDAVFCRTLRAGRGRPVLVDVAHDPVPLDERSPDGPLLRTSPLLRVALDRAYGAMDVVLVLGPRTRAQLEERYRTLRAVEIVAHGGYDGRTASSPTPAAQTPPTILFFGGWSKYKGMEGLLEAFALVRERRPEARLVLAGSAGPDVDGDGLVARAGAIGHVEVVRRYVPLAEVGPLFDRCRVCVAPYVAAKQSGVVHLAFSCGRPVVATDVGDLGEVVRTDETGILVPPGDPHALAAALVSLLDDAEEAGRLGAAALRWVEERASWDGIVEHLEEIYDRCRDAIEGTPAPVGTGPEEAMA